MSIRSFVRVAACACAAALILAACGSSDKKSDDKTGTTVIDTPVTITSVPASGVSDGGGKTANDAACKLITAQDATTLFGGTGTLNDIGSSSAVSKSVCIWQGTVDGVNYLLQIRISDGEQFYTGNIPGNESLDGIGDKAAIREAGNAAEETISYVKDGKAYTIALSAHEIGKTQLAKAKRDQLISLVKSAVNQ